MLKVWNSWLQCYKCLVSSIIYWVSTWIFVVIGLWDCLAFFPAKWSMVSQYEYKPLSVFLMIYTGSLSFFFLWSWVHSWGVVSSVIFLKTNLFHSFFASPKLRHFWSSISIVVHNPSPFGRYPSLRWMPQEPSYIVQVDELQGLICSAAVSGMLIP